ncbi:sensor histidine kinase [Agathobaculum hominis]|mgnify:FL=1
MTEHLDVGDCRLTVVPHPDGALVALEPQPLRLPRGLSYVCGDTLNASIARLYDLAAKASDPALAAALSREMFRLQRMAFHVTELLDPPVFGTINAHDCELSRLCSDVADQILRRLPEDRRDCIMTSVPMRCSSYVDAVRLRAALYNLLLNAVAVSSDPGSVTFTLTCETRPAFEDETLEYAVMTVCDRGPGLSPERFRSAVSAWCTSMSARERMRLTASGMQPGLGLAFAQLVAQAHEGTLTCAQRPGGGTEMRLAIPLFEPLTKLAPGRSIRSDFVRPMSVEDVELSIL